jgi:regulator of PEP synthase PpsR (kinase-PPPase family)
MQEALDQMNVQVHRALSDITGKTAMAIVRAIVAGERDPKVLARYRDCRCRKSEAEIAEYLTGSWRQEHLFNLQMALRLYDELEQILAAYDEKVISCLSKLQSSQREGLEPGPHPNAGKQRAMRARNEQALRTVLWRVTGVDLTRIDGIAPAAAQLVISEVGLDLSSFPSENHFAS